MKDSFNFKDQFFGRIVNSDTYTVVGAVVSSATQQGASLPLTGGGAEEVALHLGNNMQVDSDLLTEFFADFNVTEAAGVDAANEVFIGLIGGDYASNLSGVTPRAGFKVTGTTIEFDADDGTNAYSEDGSDLNATRPNRVVINVARGWEQAEVSINGKPVEGYHDLTAVKGGNLQLVAQAKGPSANELVLSTWAFHGRKAI